MALNIQRLNFNPVTGDNPSEAFMKLDLDIGEIAAAIDGDGTPGTGLDGRLTEVETTVDGLGNAATKDVGTAAGTVAAGDDVRITGAASKTYADATFLTKAGGAITGSVTIGGTLGVTGNATFGGTGNFTGKLTAGFGVFQVGSDSGNYAQMDYQARVTRNVGTNPTANSSTLVHSVTGSFGGGYAIIDGTNVIGMWSTSGALNIGFGSLNAPLTSRFTLSTNGNLSISGTLSQSDYRLKREIEEIDPFEAYNAVLAVRPIRYVRIDFPEDQQRITEGVIAHELSAVMPHLVVGTKDQTGFVDVYDDEGNVVDQNPVPVYQTVDYSGISVEMVAAFKHLDSLVKAQSTTIAGLTARIAALEGV